MSKPPVKKRSSASKKKAAGASYAAEPSAAPSASEDTLPDAAAIEDMLVPVRGFARSAGHARVRGFFERLAQEPPQVLLLEGGTSAERLAAANYWAALLNCEGHEPAPLPRKEEALSLGLPGLPSLAVPSGSAGDDESAPTAGESGNRAEAGPCLACPSCIRMISHLHRDCFFLDGTAGSIKIDDVRSMRGVLGEPPREARRRVVLFREAQSLGEAAANSLLKSFEEPRPGTSFVLLVPQRERLLSTLVSRGMVLTLPWPRAEDALAREALAPWEAALCSFLRTGRDFFERSGSRGAVDASLAHSLANLCRRAMVNCIRARRDGTPLGEGLEGLLARLPDARMRMLDEALAECQDSLIYGVNPTLVVEWLATRMYFLVPRR